MSDLRGPPAVKRPQASLCGCTLLTGGIIAVLFGLILGWFVLSFLDDLGGPPQSSDPSSSGWLAMWLGDVDGDSVGDFVLMTAREPRSGEFYDWGVTRVMSGASERELKAFPGGFFYARLDRALGTAGDIDGDERPEIWWMSGDHDLFIGTAIEDAPKFELEVDQRATVVPMGDIDGDRCADLLITAYPVQSTGTRAVSVISGRSGSVVWTVTGPARSAPLYIDFGRRVCRLSDCDGDAIDDVALVDDRGQILIVSGRSGQTIRVLPMHITKTGDLASLEDANDDGLPEIIVFDIRGNWGNSPAEDRWGNPVQVVSVADGSKVASFRTGERWIWAAFSPGDVNGDGSADIAWTTDELTVVSAIDGRELHRIEGRAVPGQGDWDRDGCTDLLVAHNITFDPFKDLPEGLWRMGRIEIISGRDGTILRTFDEGVLPPAGD